MTNDEMKTRYESYSKALLHMWETEPNKTTKTRYTIFMQFHTSQKEHWLRWVEQMATEGKIDWCTELVALAITMKLKGEMT